MASAAMMRLHNLKFMGRKLRCYWGNSSVDATTERDQNQWIQVHVGFSARQVHEIGIDSISLFLTCIYTVCSYKS